MDNVRELLSKKGNEVVSVLPDLTVFEALEVMAEKNIGAVLVVDEAQQLVGIFSERDYARKMIIKGRDDRTTKVGEIMTRAVLGVEPSTTIRECMALMTAKRIRHLPVVDQGRLVGVVSIGDVVKAIITQQELMISEQAYLIGQLERSISGSP